MLGYKYTSEPHYTGSQITQINLMGCDWYWSREREGRYSGYLRLSCWALCMIGLFYGSLNYFKEPFYRRGLELCFGAYRRMPRFLRFLFAWRCAVFTRLERPRMRCRWGNQQGHNGDITITALCFGLCFNVPKFIAKWGYERQMRRFEREAAEAEEAYWNSLSPEQQAAEEKLRLEMERFEF